MDIIPAVVEDGDYIGIPVIGGGCCWIEWKEGEDYKDALIRANPDGEDYGFVRMYETHSLGYIDEDGESTDEEFVVYEVKDSRSEYKFFLISVYEIGDPGDIFNCVCVPHNAMNLRKFYKEYG